MNVFVGMECSGTIADAFSLRGHSATSCDLKPGENRYSCHVQGDVFEVLADFPRGHFDIAILHPVCQFLSVSGYHWCYREPTKFPNTICGPRRLAMVEQAKKDFMRCVSVGVEFGIERVCVENPTGIMNTRYRKPNQTIQPYEFGNDASKATGLWLENLPPLFVTNRFPGRLVEWNGKTVERWSNQTDSGQNRLPPTAYRAALRAITYPGPAKAMAEQWG